MSTPAQKAALAAEFNLSPAEIQYELSHAGQSRESTVLAAVGTCSTLATMAILLRIWVRRSNQNRFMADDYNIFVAFVSICQGELNCSMLTLIMRQMFSWASFVAIYYRIISWTML